VLVENLQIWSEFANSKAHLLRLGNEEWPANKILLQLAYEHADKSPITKAVETWGAEQAREPISFWHQASKNSIDGATMDRPVEIPQRPFKSIIICDYPIERVLMLTDEHLAIIHEHGVCSVWSMHPSPKHIINQFMDTSQSEESLIHQLQMVAGTEIIQQSLWKRHINSTSNAPEPDVNDGGSLISDYSKHMSGIELEFLDKKIHLRKDGCVELEGTEFYIGEGPVDLHFISEQGLLISCGSCSSDRFGGSSSRLILFAPDDYIDFCNSEYEAYRLIAGEWVPGYSLTYARNELCVLISENLLLSLGWSGITGGNEDSLCELFELSSNGVDLIACGTFRGDWPINFVGLGEDGAIHIGLSARHYVWVPPYDEYQLDRVGKYGYPLSAYAPFEWELMPDESERIVIPEGVAYSKIQITESETGPVISEDGTSRRWITDNPPYGYIPTQDFQLLCVEDTGYTILKKSNLHQRAQ